MGGKYHASCWLFRDLRDTLHRINIKSSQKCTGSPSLLARRCACQTRPAPPRSVHSRSAPPRPTPPRPACARPRIAAPCEATRSTFQGRSQKNISGGALVLCGLPIRLGLHYRPFTPWVWAPRPLRFSHFGEDPVPLGLNIATALVFFMVGNDLTLFRCRLSFRIVGN